MKILISSFIFYPSQIGGPANALSWMAESLKKKGIETFIVSTMKGIDPKSVRKNKWRQTQFGETYYAAYTFMQFPIKMIYTTIKKLKDVNIVHLNSIFYFPELVIAIIAILLNKQVVWAAEGNLSENALSRKTLKKRLYLKVVKLLFSKKVYFHSSSALETTDIRKIFGRTTKIIEFPNFITLPKIIDCKKDRMLLWVGRFDPIKALENLIISLNYSTTFREQNYRLCLVGDYNNEYGHKIKNLVTDLGLEEVVHFVGHVSGDMKFQLYASAKYLVLPSHSENFGNVVTESMSQGTPVIASTGTPWQILEDNKAGFWCDNSSLELSKTIDKALAMSEEDYLECKTNALNLLKSQFCVNTNIQKWIDAYMKLIK